VKAASTASQPAPHSAHTYAPCMRQIFSDLIAVKLSDVNRDIEMSENPQRGLADDGGEENVGVSDDAFDKHENPL